MRMRSLSFGVVLLLLALSGALLLGTGAVAAQEAESDPAPLTVTLTSSRDVCTANTLTELTWAITGGNAPYRLSIDGEAVGRTATSHRANCGPLTTNPESGDPLPNQTKTFTATVTDSRGVSATGTDLAELMEPLPAPENGRLDGANGNFLVFAWHTAETPPGGDDLVAFLVRSREVGSPAWDYRSEAPAVYGYGDIPYSVTAGFGGGRDAVTYEVGVAAMRHPLEAETPAALRWTPNLQATTVTDPGNVTTTATHDTVTVRWDRQPSATEWSIGLSNPDGSRAMRISPSDAEAWGDPASATHEVTFRHLVPDTEYNLSVGSGGSEILPGRWVEVTVRTKPAPAGHTPLPRGPQNLRATATATSITVTWDPPYAGARQSYRVYLFGPDGRRFYTEGVYGPPWTFTFTSSAVNGGLTPWYLAPETTYRISVSHFGAVDADAEISIATQPAQAGSSGRASASPERNAAAPTCFEISPGWRICPNPAATPA